MQKILAILSCIVLVSYFDDAAAKSYKHKNKSHYGRLKKRRRHRGNGPDLKAITKDSAYTENPNNGVTPIETTGIAK